MRALFRRSPAARVPPRGVALVVAAVIAGAAVLLAGGNDTSGDPSRLDVGLGRAAAAPAVGGAAPIVDLPDVAPSGSDTVAPGTNDLPPSSSSSPSSSSPTPSSSSTAGPVRTTPAAPVSAAASTSTSSPPTSTSSSTSTVVQSTTTTTTSAPPSGPVQNLDIEAQVVPLTNTDRGNAGLGTLSRSGCLDSAASDYAAKLARSGALVHNPDSAAAVRACRPNAAWGDNIGTARPCSASLIEEKWMESPTHRHNILTPEFQYMGVGSWTDQMGNCWIQVLFSS